MSGARPVVRILGAGPTGALLAILMQRRGMAVELFESRPDPRSGSAASGRSINLALAERGIHALQIAGVIQSVRPAMLPMRGRLIHQQDGATSLQPYGQRPHELIYSVSRDRLNQVLLDVAEQQPGIEVHFEHRFEGADFRTGIAHIRDLRAGRVIDIPMQPLLAADGAGSSLRRSLHAQHLIEAHETDLAHGYKELSIPADAAQGYAMAADALHIWPRGDHMLIALPNADASFTATLFLPKTGPDSFATLTETGDIERFMSRSFPDAVARMPHCVEEFKTHPVGFLGTVSVAPWAYGGMTALIGDAAHAIVPFHGQGMNCCFEDCIEFDACLGRHARWDAVFAEFAANRKPDTDAIAEMSLDNYLEMRERVVDPKFQLQQQLALELERRHPRQFIPRYSMVTFHHDIPYRVARQRGITQSALLEELTAGPIASLADVDFGRAAREISARLPRL